MTIDPIHANSSEGGIEYRLLRLIHQMAGSIANSNRKEFWLSKTNSEQMYGPILTVWSNGIIDIEARTWRDQEPAYHEYSLVPCRKEAEE